MENTINDRIDKAQASKTLVKFALITSAIIIVFQVGNHFVIYDFLKFDHYLTIVAVVFFAAGMFLNRGKEIIREVKVEILKEVVAAPVNNPAATLSNLTNKEFQILRLIIQGKSNKEIAAANFVEISTIKTHINNLYAKISVKNRKEACHVYSTILKSDPED
jgi:DNA-binding CsgD family transcriptional regulator